MTTQVPTQEQIRNAWDAIAPRFDEFTTPEAMRVGEQIVARAGVRSGTRVLDVGAGSGALAVLAARLGGEVTAVDIAPTMIELLRNRARAENLPNLAGQVMDGLALEFADDSFDVSVSLNGVSVFPNLSGGLAEMARVTRPGGRVLVGAFGPMPKAEFIAFFLGAMKAVVPGFTGLPADPPPPPFQVADPDVFRGRLVEAGLTEVSVDQVTWEMRISSATHFWNVFTSSNPIGAQLVANLTPVQRAEVQQVLDGMLRERSGGGPGATLHARVNVGTGIA
jgi:ubiquinone/menaquinone biosynthesis C-methylase UbiE